MKSDFKIAVVGPIPQDTIKTHKNETILKYGCVTHPTVALAKLMDGEGQVIPIANVHKMDVEPISELLKDYDAIDLSGISSEKDAGTIIELNFIDQNNRLEKQIANMSPISDEDIRPFLAADCFVFVPITDFEIDISALKLIKSESNARIIFDAHGPTTYVTDNGQRLRRYWAERDEWLPLIDVLKMNLEESLCCWFNRDHNDLANFDEDDTHHLEDFAKYILDAGVEHLFVTLDSRGCAIYKKHNGEIISEFVESVTVVDVIDTTGCGDSFAGGLAYGFTKYNDPIKAAHFANTLGALR
ncbi:MAG: carbohydrate kinase family protein, partial [Bacteroidota bacterium]